MSYDLLVATHERPLLVPADASHAPLPFEIDGPFSVEIEDLDEALVQAVLAPRWLVEISVPMGAPQRARAKARTHGRELADRYRGAVFDPQEERIVWPHPKKRRYISPAKQERIDVIQLEWLFRHSRRRRDTAAELLKLFRQHCPQALPQRFGEFEPLQGRLKRDGDEAFAQAWSDVDAGSMMLFWKGTLPCFDGSACLVGSGDPKPDRPVTVDILFDARALQQPAWREAVAGLFTAVAVQLGAFAGGALVERDWLAERGRLWADNQTGRVSLDIGGTWRGWRPLPAWLLWFGSDYVDKVIDRLDGFSLDRRSSGIAVRLNEAPAAVDETWPELPPDVCARPRALLGHTVWDAAAWLPALADEARCLVLWTGSRPDDRRSRRGPLEA